LMKAIYPSLTPEELDILISSDSITEDLGPDGRDDEYGHGLIDAFRAIVASQDLSGGGVLPLMLVVNPTTLNFGPKSTAVLTVEKAGGNTGDQLLINTPTVNVPWLDIIEENVDADNLGAYTIIVNRNQLDPGIYTAAITVDADNPVVDDVEVPVSMQVVTPIEGGNAGFHYVLLVDSETLEFQAQDNVPFNPGGYAYSFTNIPAGTYKIFAGTDSNNDLFIGDSGEAYGAYLTLDQLVSITISEDQSDLDFDSNFAVNFPSQLTVGERPERPTLQRPKAKDLAR